MRKIFIILFAFLPLTAFAENPFLGSWEVELVGQTDGMRWEVLDDATIKTWAKNAVTPGATAYELDERAGEIVLESGGTQSMRLRYVFDNAGFSLYLTDVVNSPYYDMFLSSFVKPLEKMQGVNTITDEAIAHMKTRLKDLLEGMPVMRGRRSD